jgi:hypothetical protein
VTLGTVIAPTNKMSLSIDYFKIDLKDHHRQRRGAGHHPG